MRLDSTGRESEEMSCRCVRQLGGKRVFMCVCFVKIRFITTRGLNYAFAGGTPAVHAPRGVFS